MRRYKVYLKSGNTFEFECEEFTGVPLHWAYSENQTTDRLELITKDAVEAIVRIR